MSKIQEFYEEAECCYIQQDMTFNEIAARFGIAEKTVRNWADEGKWRERRNEYRQKRESLDEKLHKFVDKLMDSIMDDWENGKQVDPGRMYAFNNLLGKLDKVQKVEAAKRQVENDADQNKPLDSEALINRVREAVGLNKK